MLVHLKWVSLRSWKADEMTAAKQVNASFNKPAATAKDSNKSADANSALRPVLREDFVRSWSDFLAHFAEIEDVRFKLKESIFADSHRLTRR
jgi:hypothetical protein